MADEWCLLPDHLIIRILSNLSIRDAYAGALSCRSWWSVFEKPQLWRRIEFVFTRGTSEDEKYLNALYKYGEYFRNVTVKVDQSNEENRRLGVKLLTKLSEAERGCTKYLRLQFTGTNPLFYGGQEFVDALGMLFQSTVHNFQFIDLSLAPVMYTDNLVLTLTGNHHSHLRYLNIQTKQYICKIEPSCMQILAESCKKLIDLRVCHSSLSNDVLLAFADRHPDRYPLRHLSILCRRQEKYFHHDLSEITWIELIDVSPELEVTLKYDPTCPLDKVREIMKPQIPVRHLYMEMHTNAHEIALAAEYYHNTLTKLVVQGRPTPMFQSALIDAAELCHRLRSIHVMCVLEKITVELIMLRRPELKEAGEQVTLKYEMEPHPWVTDEILDELPNYL